MCEVVVTTTPKTQRKAFMYHDVTGDDKWRTQNTEKWTNIISYLNTERSQNRTTIAQLYFIESKEDSVLWTADTELD